MYVAYIDRKEVCWGMDEQTTIDSTYSLVRHEPILNGVLPCAIIWNSHTNTFVAIITDDANGLKAHQIK